MRARGLQALAEKPVACRPGALTGRVFKHALKATSKPCPCSRQCREDHRDTMNTARRSRNQSGARPDPGRSAWRVSGALEFPDDFRHAYALRAGTPARPEDFAVTRTTSPACCQFFPSQSLAPNSPAKLGHAHQRLRPAPPTKLPMSLRGLARLRDHGLIRKVGGTHPVSVHHRGPVSRHRPPLAAARRRVNWRCR